MNLDRVQTCLQALRQNLDELEAILGEIEKPKDPYARRRDLLEHIYVQRGIERPELMKAVREAGTAYQWIGQQVKKGYLRVPGKEERKYTVTSKAVRELELSSIEEAADARAYTAMADEAFAEDWDSPEDAIYDKL
jgi:hypothetical protein